ncbi:cysteine dioxygenase family protein [Nitratireductor sp. ZSWI3]|uniref:cysteine dioxygenase family protein n=1 Tax=Nitratireductor sp. ZSWI3 TaxID=2966359 RepID=UPI00214F7869|nr:cysteine dioxygenase family protein [Nitratireductor sp. ZSWI3]MCR4266896.1 cysteine dioxygenase family protein [Nitratireductor sp. ZSWI3]
MANPDQTDIARSREEKVKNLISGTRAMLDGAALDRPLLDRIRGNLQALADQPSLWSEADFPPPEGEEKQARYLIGSEGPQGITLYLNVMRAGKKIPPHNHTVWACIAAVEGSEHNTLYTREDDGSVDGHAKLSVREVFEIAPGQSLAMMPDDIHSVEIRGDQIIRHLHFYDRPLETLVSRVTFDLDNDTCKIMSVGVKTRT